MNHASLDEWLAGTGVTLGLSERVDGPMRWVDSTVPMPAARARFLERVGLRPERAVSARLAHGNRAAIVTAAEGGRLIEEVDGIGGGVDALVTSVPGVALTITVADCLPVFLFDPVSGIIGLAHAGWRGVLADVAGQTIQAMCDLEAHTEGIRALIGPHLRSCHFQVQPEVEAEFAAYGNHIIRRDGSVFIDLSGIVRQQLTEAGIQPENIQEDPRCTFCDSSSLPSYRRDGSTALDQAMLAYIVRVH
ncbi:MAG: polyphenol oxidase family protein [Patescibacteria group bacterium]|nr:polyphenol oxidase family protein [Patescibacteria group bacterium]